MKSIVISCLQCAVALGIITLFGGCEHAKFNSDHGGQTNPWASPESFENSGAGTPLGLMGGQGR
jgi:hypothetical protein